MTIEQDISESIAKNLPQAVGVELRKRLEQADKEAAKVKHLEILAESSASTITNLSHQIGVLQEKLKDHEELAKREAAVAERERNARLSRLEVELDCARGNTEFARSVALGLVRNVEYRNSVHETVTNKSHPVTGANGSCGVVSQAYQPEHTTTTTTQEIK